MDNVLVSVVVATFNAEKYILELLESIKNQTYKCIELIIADDCSTDNTQDIVRAWVEDNATRFKRTELLFAQNNRGTSKNYNCGMKKCQGEFIKLVDGDDLLLPEGIEILVKECQDKKLDLLIGDVMWVQDDGVTYAEHYEDSDKKYEFYKMDAENQHKELLLNNDIIITVGEIFRRSFMERFNWFDEQYDLLEDYPFWLRITDAGIKIPFIDKKVAKYRISTTSVRNPVKNTFIYNVRISKASKKNFYKLRLTGLLREKRIRLILRNMRRYFIRDLVIFLGNSNSNKICRGLTLLE